MTEINTTYIYKTHCPPKFKYEPFADSFNNNVIFDLHLLDEERAGFAKRHHSYKKTLEEVRTYKSEMNENSLQVTKSELFHVIGQGLKFLTPPEKTLLAFYVSFLNMAELSKGKSYIWAGTRLTCDLLGISQKTLRRHKASLEGKGLILRNYDRRNRPEEGQAIDLLPFIVRLDEYQTDIEDVFGKQRDYWQKMQSSQSGQYEGYDPYFERSKKSAQAVTSVPLKQTLIDLSVSVPKEDRNRDVAVNSKSSAFRGHDTIKDKFALLGQGVPTAVNPDARKSPKVLTKGSRSDLDSPSQLSTTQLPETPPQSVFNALQLSPVLLDGREVEEAKAMSAVDLWEWLAVRVSVIFPNHNTASHTWPWSIKKFGWRAVELLVVALEDPQIKDGSKFIGGMTHKWDYPLQLSPNLKRIKALREKDKLAGQQDLKVAKLKLESLFHERLSHHLKRGEFLGWFSKLSVVETVSQLTLVTEKPFHARWLEQNFRSQITRAALGKEILIKSKKEG